MLGTRKRHEGQFCNPLRRFVRLLTGLNARIRGVAQGPDEALYVLTDGNGGTLLRLVPKP